MDLTFAAIVNHVARKLGVDLSAYRESYLIRRIEYRMKMLNVGNVHDYYRLLKNSEEEVRELLNVITINVTEFMRDVTPFEYLRKVVIPEIARRKERLGSRMIRIWSAGCACGEEPYSIAICALEELNGWQVSIYATDIDEFCLEKARKGVYSAKQLAKLEPSIVEKYFEKVPGGYGVRDFVKRCVRFKRHDLTTEPPVSRHFDIVFCRNVMIYFNERQKEKVVRDFYEALSSGGYLFIGKSETLPEKAKGLFECVNVRDKVYRKVS
ncbi:MAG: protein-glutamate O-methyltransferase CheR [Archaeoglobaceae archaeon]